MRLNLTNAQRRELDKVIQEGFTAVSFDYVLNAYCGKSITDIVESKPWQYQVLPIIDELERRFWTDLVLIGAREQSPDNLELYQFIESLGLAARTGPGTSFEAMVTEAGFIDLPVLIEGLLKAEGTVCRIELPDHSTGTGFLVAPDKILTNHHVVKSVIDKLVDVEKVAIRFDFKQLASGADVHPGTVHRLAGDPVLSTAEPSGIDEDPNRVDDERDPGRLDYALLQLAEEAGSEEVGRRRGARQRGWIQVEDQVAKPQVGDRLLIVQHPSLLPLAVDAGHVLAYNRGRSRVRYDVNTIGGSSGSPVFDERMRLVALHHLGDPDMERPAAFNQGIPIDKIRGHFPEQYKSVLTPQA